MKAALKFIMTLVGLLLICANVGVVLLLTQFEGLLRDGLTHQAGQILGAEVHLEAVRLDWAEQALVFKGVSVFNPEGFTDREALRIDALWVRPDLLTMFARTPTIQEIAVQTVSLHLQYQPGTATNLGAMMARAREWSDGQAGGERRVWGRPMQVDRLRSDPVAFQVRSSEPASAEMALEVAAFAVDDPAAGEAVSGARVIHLILKHVMRRLVAVEAMPGPAQELLLGEVDLEAA